MATLSFNSQNINPDLIVEVTRACDHSFGGCYAPNVLVSKNAGDYQNQDGLFLSRLNLQDCLDLISEPMDIVSVRGGEPTLHPNLEGLLQNLHSKARVIVLETHGRWLVQEPETLLKSLKQNAVVVKISFDTTHAIDASLLQKMIEVLDRFEIDYLVAITESTLDTFFKTFEPISLFVDHSKVIFQEKLSDFSRLVKPRIGVISAAGEFRTTISPKTSQFALEVFL